MKIKPEHYEYIRDTILARIPPESYAQFRQNIEETGKFKDLDKRTRWDMLYIAVTAMWISENVYPYADDTHIDTALRKIIGDHYE